MVFRTRSLSHPLSHNFTGPLMRSNSLDGTRPRSTSAGHPPPQAQQPAVTLAPIASRKPVSRPPVKPTAPRTAWSRHLRTGIDTVTGTPRIEFISTAAHALNERVKTALLKRLHQPEKPLAGWPAANALIDLCSQHSLPPALCLTLIADKTLWETLCRAKPNGSRARAAVVAALLRLGDAGLAAQVLGACPAGRDRRLVVRRLLKDPSQPLNGPRSPEWRSLIDASFDDLLGKENGQYEDLRPAIVEWRRQWACKHQEVGPLLGLQAELRQMGFCIDVGLAGLVTVTLEEGIEATPALLNLLLSYVSAGLMNEATADLTVDVLFKGLQAFGLCCGDGQSVYLAEATQFMPFKQQCLIMRSERLVALTAFVRQACVLLLGTDLAAAIESLLRASLWLQDPMIRTDPGYQKALLQAVAVHGCAGLWLKTQHYQPKDVSTTLLPTLLDCLKAIESPRAALRFVRDVLAFLKHIGQSIGMEADGPQRIGWIEVRDDWLDRVLHGLARLVKRSAKWPTPEGEALAQWAWLTAAVLELTRRGDDDRHPGVPPPAERLYFSPCLAHFQLKGEPFSLSLELLGSEASLLHTFHPSLDKMRALFALCPIKILSCVLHWPVPSLWTPQWMSRPISADEVLIDERLGPDVQLTVLRDLLERGLLRPEKLAPALSRLAAAKGFHALIALCRTHPELDGVAFGTLIDMGHPGNAAANWRPGLPVVLAWLQDNADPTSETHARAVFTALVLGIRRLRHTPQANDQDLRDVGAGLCLSPQSSVLKVQLDTLVNQFNDPAIVVPLLQGWIRQRVTRLVSGALAQSPSERALLKTVLDRYRKLLNLLHDLEQRVPLLDELAYFDGHRKMMKK